jgi:hypothetical protein
MAKLIRLKLTVAKLSWATIIMAKLNEMKLD